MTYQDESEVNKVNRFQKYKYKAKLISERFEENDAELAEYS